MQLDSRARHTVSPGAFCSSAPRTGESSPTARRVSVPTHPTEQERKTHQVPCRLSICAICLDNGCIHEQPLKQTPYHDLCSTAARYLPVLAITVCQKSQLIPDSQSRRQSLGVDVVVATPFRLVLVESQVRAKHIESSQVIAIVVQKLGSSDCGGLAITSSVNPDGT